MLGLALALVPVFVFAPQRADQFEPKFEPVELASLVAFARSIASFRSR